MSRVKLVVASTIRISCRSPFFNRDFCLFFYNFHYTITCSQLHALTNLHIVSHEVSQVRKLSWGRKHQNSSISFPFSQCTCTQEFFKIWHHFRLFYFIICYLCELHNDCIMVRPARYVHVCKSTDLIFITFRITDKHKLQGKFNFHEQAHIQYILGYVYSQMKPSILQYKNMEHH